MNGDDKTAAAEVKRLQELLGLARRFGRLSLWERNRKTGEGRWDPDIFALFGLPVAERSPPLAVSMALIHAEDRGPAQHAFEASLRCPGQHEVRYRVPHADGHLTWVHSIWHVPVEGDLIHGVVIDDSQTVQLATQNALARSQLDLVAEVAGVGLWTWDLDTGTQHWNPAMRAIHGLSDDDPVPAAGEDRISAAVLPEDRPALADNMELMLAPGAPRVEARWRIRRADGTLRTLVGRARRVEAAPRLIVGVAMDVTDLQAAEIALREKEAVEQASRAKSEFLSRMSHELRTPPNAVLGFADLLLGDEDEPPHPGQRERLNHLRLAGHQLLTLIDEVLEIARHDGSANAAAATAALQALLAREGVRPAEALARAAPDGVTHELVYVEDNPVNLLLVQQVVAQRPHLRLHGAATLSDGEALVRRVRPALVLVDLHLPDGDGIELPARLRDGPDPVHAPCVVLSADAQAHQVQRALAAGFVDYWTKPIDVAGLLGALDDRLSA